MEFEFDAEKSESNLSKHGIDFIEAQLLWADQARHIIEARSFPESRFALIAKHKEKFWTAIYTTREDRIRIISVRRSRDEERYIYDFSRGV